MVRGITRQLGIDDPRAIEGALVGMAWVATMLHEEGVDAEAAMDVPAMLSTNVHGNLPATVMERLTLAQAIDLGIGAGFYTGLWMGLLMRDAV